MGFVISQWKTSQMLIINIRKDSGRIAECKIKMSIIICICNTLLLADDFESDY